jgi:hypothetical protein
MATKKPVKSKSRFVIIRTYSAGVHFGTLESRKGKEVVLSNSRRVWSWSGAASLSQMAMEGLKNLDQCKISMAVNSIILTEAIEVIECTKVAQNNLESVPVWKV